MDLRSHIKKDSLSHAYIIEGEREEGLSALRTLMESLEVEARANPDYHEYIFETLLLEDAHHLRREQSMRGGEGKKKIFVVAFNGITGESQNALLKTLEEPTDNTHFFFLVRTSAMLLPTVRSRMQLVRPANAVAGGANIFAQKFLHAGVSERLKMIERMTKAKTEDKPRAKEEARVFIGALETLLYEKFQSLPSEYKQAIEDVIVAKHELAGRAPSIKILLEHLALTLPAMLESATGNT